MLKLSVLLKFYLIYYSKHTLKEWLFLKMKKVYIIFFSWYVCSISMNMKFQSRKWYWTICHTTRNFLKGYILYCWRRKYYWCTQNASNCLVIFLFALLLTDEFPFRNEGDRQLFAVSIVKRAMITKRAI